MKTSNVPKIDLTALIPQETFYATSMTISGNEPPIYLEPFTLHAQLWLAKKYKTEAEIKQLFIERDVEKLCELGHFLAKDKERFPTFESFLKKHGNALDSIMLVNALLKTIGLSQPEIEQITGDVQVPKKKAPPKKKVPRTGR